jgi:mercuric ion transport protein
MKVSREGLTLTGALAAGLVASACCLGPLVLAIVGMGGAAFALALEPYRPYLLVLTAAFLGLAFYLTYRRPASACGPGEACEMPQANRVGKILLWLVTLVVILAATFPYYSRYLF